MSPPHLKVSLQVPDSLGCKCPANLKSHNKLFTWNVRFVESAPFAMNNGSLHVYSMNLRPTSSYSFSRKIKLTFEFLRQSPLTKFAALECLKNWSSGSKFIKLFRVEKLENIGFHKNKTAPKCHKSDLTVYLLLDYILLASTRVKMYFFFT